MREVVRLLLSQLPVEAMNQQQYVLGSPIKWGVRKTKALPWSFGVMHSKQAHTITASQTYPRYRTYIASKTPRGYVRVPAGFVLARVAQK